MKIRDLTEVIIGQRIRVTGVAKSLQEEEGYTNDSEVLMGETGTAEDFKKHGTLGRAQLRVAWDSNKPGALCLVNSDEIEIID